MVSPLGLAFNVTLDVIGFDSLSRLMKKTTINPIDYHFIQDKPDEDFSPTHNEWVIEETIRKTNANRKKRYEEWRKTMGERNHAVASYLIHLNRKGTPIEQYFSKNYLSYLRGDDVRTMLQTRLSPKAWRNQHKILRTDRQEG